MQLERLRKANASKQDARRGGGAAAAAVPSEGAAPLLPEEECQNEVGLIAGEASPW
jgi:hypothetical protein